MRCGNSDFSLETLYNGPFAIVEAGKKVFNIKMVSKIKTITLDHLKPHLGATAPDITFPSRRGRPPLAPVMALVSMVRWSDPAVDSQSSSAAMGSSGAV